MANKTRSTTAPDSAVVSETFRITHPFHPLVGQKFEIVERRAIRTHDLVFYLDASGCLRSIGASCTNLVTPDPVVVIGAGRAHFRVVDLLALRRIVEDLRR